MRKITKVNRFEVVDWTNSSETGRAFVKWDGEKYQFYVYYDIQDKGGTLKIFLMDRLWKQS